MGFLLFLDLYEMLHGVSIEGHTKDVCWTPACSQLVGGEFQALQLIVLAAFGAVD